jgi:hypothetical protein
MAAARHRPACPATTRGRRSRRGRTATLTED